jgi:uroporphyrinogen-III synthase
MKMPLGLVVRGDDDFSRRLREDGCEVVNLRLIRTEPVEDMSGLDERLAGLDSYDGVFVTSQNAAEVFVSRLRETGRSFGGKVYVLGERSRAIAGDDGLKVEFRSEANTAEEMIDSFGTREFAGKKFLFVRGNLSRRTIPDTLGNVAKIDEVEVYRTLTAEVDEDLAGAVRGRLAGGEVDWICFFSPSGVERFAQLFEVDAAKVAVIGKTTAAAAERAGLNVDLISPTATGEGFASSLINEIRMSA